MDESLGEFDTLVMFGNNFGLFGSRAKARRLLRQLRPFVRRIVATSNDPFGTDDPVHLGYHERNRNRGRMPGQLRLRVRYRDLIGPWFEYLIVSPEEMAEIVEERAGRFAISSKTKAPLCRRARTAWLRGPPPAHAHRGLGKKSARARQHGRLRTMAGHGEDDAGDAVSTLFRNGIFPTWSSQNAEESSVVTPVNESQHTPSNTTTAFGNVYGRDDGVTMRVC